MQEAQKDASPDWLGDGMIHSASNLLPGRANSDFDQNRLMLALVAQKVGPPEVTEREKRKKSPVHWGLLGGNGDGNIFGLSTHQCKGREPCSTVERGAGDHPAAWHSFTLNTLSVGLGRTVVPP